LVSNRDFFGSRGEVDDGVPQEIRNVLFDPQTSGGLLIFCRPHDAGALMQKLHGGGVDAFSIGQTSAPSTGAALIRVT
jgi:selenide,water dikinase